MVTPVMITYPSVQVLDRSARIARSVWLIALIVLFVGAAGTADANTKYASLVVDATTGEILHADNANRRLHPASLTKLMTVYLMFEAVTSGRWTMDTRLEVSERAAARPASKLNLPAGGTIPVETAIRALVVKSANDVATAVAENLAGTEESFARLMTLRARQLGMQDTVFRNASGLHDAQQVSTARDIAILAIALMRHYPQYYGYFKLGDFWFDGTRITGHNRLLGSYPGAEGMKTGYIRAAGFNLVTSAQRGGRRLIGVVFGGRTARSRDQHMVELLDRSFGPVAVNAPMVPVPPPKPAVPGTGGAPLQEATAVPVPPLDPRAAQPETWVTATAGANPSDDPGDVDRPEDGPVGSRGADEDAGFEIQVGAFTTETAATSAAQSARHLLDPPLDGVPIRIVRFERSGIPLFRARLGGLDRADASAACADLSRRTVPCQVIAPTSRMASAAH